MMLGSSTRRSFATRFASLFAGAGIAGLFSNAAASAGQVQGGVQKLNYEGKPAGGTGFITPLIVHNGVIYIAGQGAHSRDKGETFPKDIEKQAALEYHFKVEIGAKQDYDRRRRDLVDFVVARTLEKKASRKQPLNKP